MYFNSLQFVGFYVAVWLMVGWALRPATLRLLLPRGLDTQTWALKLRNAFLLVASYVFYGAWNWKFLGLIVLSTLVDFACGRLLEAPNWQASVRRKALVATSVTTNLAILGFFKYHDFFAQSLADLLDALGWHTNPFLLEVILPVGISFYTFQTMGYTIDVYRRKVSAERSLLNFSVYVAFFPQLVAGPIERAAALLPQIARPTRIDREALVSGAFLMSAGFFKKVVIADNVAKVADAAFALGDPTGLQSLVGVYAFAIQIYCDFSGYSDIARGCSRCIGFELRLNFNMPYFATNPSDFWQRWHISLSSWLRDYLYISLGGNRHGTYQTYRNLMLTMLLGGLWHGAAWTFVVWGAFHGTILCLYRAATPLVARVWPREGVLGRLAKVASVIFFFHLVCVSWLLFRAESIAQAWEMLLAIVHTSLAGGARQLAALGPVPLFIACSITILVVQLLQLSRGNLTAVARLPVVPRAVIYAVGLIAFLLVGEYGGSAFIYFQF